MESQARLYFCCDERRRNEIRTRPDLNGIDFLEVLDTPSMPDEERQRTLQVFFINDSGGLSLSEQNVLISGGDRIRNIRVLAAQIEDISIDPNNLAATRRTLVVKVDRPGDFSTYTLRLEPDRAEPHKLDHFDPLLRSVDFSFKVNCNIGFDCEVGEPCPTQPALEPTIDYLARDYASLRQLILDRLAVISPRWKERNPADLGIALVELLAYVGDYLSYYQDAIATEAYLTTSRSRVSARRHARLVDYFIHDGSNARTWVQVQVEGGIVQLERGVQLITSLRGEDIRLSPNFMISQAALGLGAEVFETMHAATLYPAHNRMSFYTWGARECCLPEGATRATLLGSLPNLTSGCVLVFQEVRSPRTGDPDDADAAHRHAVRLVEVTPSVDPLGGRFGPYPNDNPVEVTEIRWADDDALPFALCISAEADPSYGGGFIDDVSIALGNIVLADHGLTIKEEPIGVVPDPVLERIVVRTQIAGQGASGLGSEDRCREMPVETVPPRFRPSLKEGPLTQAASYDPENPPASASAAFRGITRDILPSVSLHSRMGYDETLWLPQRDLLNSDSEAAEFVVEVESDGSAYLRFGDGVHGIRPPSGAVFTATYRVGNGERGNIGADSLIHIISPDAAIVRVTNPMPARGGQEPETIEQVRQRAPSAFRTQARAVTAEDYADVTSRHSQVQRATATFRWTGSWRTIFVNVDRRGGGLIDDQFETELREFIEPFRMAGHDLEIDRPKFVSLEITMLAHLKPGYFRRDVRTALLRTFSRQSVFHPDNFTFGQTVFLSPLLAAAQAVEGVDFVEITTFQRMDAPGTEGLEDAKLVFSRFEIPRLDNNPNFPDRGVFNLILEGGK